MRFSAIAAIAACVVLAGCASNNAGTTRNLSAGQPVYGSTVYGKTPAVVRTSTPSASTAGAISYRAPRVQTYATRPTNQTAARRNTRQATQSAPMRQVTTQYGTVAVPPPPPPPPLYGSASGGPAGPSTVAARLPVRSVSQPRPAVRQPVSRRTTCCPPVCPPVKKTGWQYNAFRSATKCKT